MSEDKMILYLSQNDKGENEIWLDGKKGRRTWSDTKLKVRIHWPV